MNSLQLPPADAPVEEHAAHLAQLMRLHPNVARAVRLLLSTPQDTEASPADHPTSLTPGKCPECLAATAQEELDTFGGV